MRWSVETVLPIYHPPHPCKAPIPDRCDCRAGGKVSNIDVGWIALHSLGSKFQKSRFSGFQVFRFLGSHCSRVTGFESFKSSTFQIPKSAVCSLLVYGFSSTQLFS